MFYILVKDWTSPVSGGKRMTSDLAVAVVVLHDIICKQLDLANTV